MFSLWAILGWYYEYGVDLGASDSRVAGVITKVDMEYLDQKKPL